MALEYWEHKKLLLSTVAGSKIARVMREEYGDVPLPITPLFDVQTLDLENTNFIAKHRNSDEHDYYLSSASIYLGLLEIKKGSERLLGKTTFTWQGSIRTPELIDPFPLVFTLFREAFKEPYPNLLKEIKVYIDEGGSPDSYTNQKHMDRYRQIVSKGDFIRQLFISVPYSWGSSQYQFYFSNHPAYSSSGRPELKVVLPSVPTMKPWSAGLLDWILRHHLQKRALRRLIDPQKTAALINALQDLPNPIPGVR